MKVRRAHHARLAHWTAPVCTPRVRVWFRVTCRSQADVRAPRSRVVARKTLRKAETEAWVKRNPGPSTREHALQQCFSAASSGRPAGDMAREAGHSQRGVNKATERTGQEKHRTIPGRLHVPAEPEGTERLEVAHCDLQFERKEGPSLSASRLHGAGSTTDASCA